MLQPQSSSCTLCSSSTECRAPRQRIKGNERRIVRVPRTFCWFREVSRITSSQLARHMHTMRDSLLAGRLDRRSRQPARPKQQHLWQPVCLGQRGSLQAPLLPVGCTQFPRPHCQREDDKGPSTQAGGCLSGLRDGGADGCLPGWKLFSKLCRQLAVIRTRCSDSVSFKDLQLIPPVTLVWPLLGSDVIDHIHTSLLSTCPTVADSSKLPP